MILDRSANPNESIFNLAVTWILLIPIICMAAGIGASILHFSASNDSSQDIAAYGNLISPTQTGDKTIVAVFVLLIMSACILFRIKSITNLALGSGVFVAQCFIAVLSTAWSIDPMASLKYAIYLSVGTLFGFYLYSRFSSLQLKQLIVIAGAICLLASYMLIVFFPFYGKQTTQGLNCWRGIYTTKNLCAAFTVYFMSPVFYLPIKSLQSQFLRAAYILLSSLLIIMSQSRGGWALLLVVVAITALFTAKRYVSSQEITLLRVVVFCLLAVFIVITFYDVGAMLSLVGKDVTLSQRTGIWEAVLGAIVKHPILGYGYKAFWTGYYGESATIALTFGWAVNASHNGFLEVWLGLGIVGLLAVLLSMLQAFHNMEICRHLGCNENCDWYSCVVALMIVHNFSEAQIMAPNDLTWILYVIACTGLFENARISIRVNLREGK